MKAEQKNVMACNCFNASIHVQLREVKREPWFICLCMYVCVRSTQTERERERDVTLVILIQRK